MKSAETLLFAATWTAVEQWPVHGFEEVKQAGPLDLRGIDSIGLALLWSILTSEPWLGLADRIGQEVWPYRDDKPWLNILAPEFTTAIAGTALDSASLARSWHTSLGGLSPRLSESDILALLVGIRALASKAVTASEALFLWDDQRLTE